MYNRIFVKKKVTFQIENRFLLDEIKESLNEKQITNLEIYNIYDIEGGSENIIEILKNKIIADRITDDVLDHVELKDNYIAIEPLPGQYDQRADWAMQALSLSLCKEKVSIKTGKLIVLHGRVNNLDRIKKYLINPIESREKNLLDSTDTFNSHATQEIIHVQNFLEFTSEDMESYRIQNNLSMSHDDLMFTQNYFIQEGRNPTETEIQVIDTYWSDHCRHTTFETNLSSITFNAGNLKEEIKKSFDRYTSLRKEIGRDTLPMTLMDIATIGRKKISQLGLLNDLEETTENNACSIHVDVDVNGQVEEWLLMFKNETHNHPTEIEPYGGASTCIGGAIRDPLSGRAYVYQGMRISGAGNICEVTELTLPNKLPQKTISKEASRGFSSYGNQIGLSTTFVKEIFHPGFKAKRMEVGAVVAATPKKNIIREEPIDGDVIILIGGKTGRDGIGGATGSSKEQNDNSLRDCFSEVQKGNAPVERALQRAFRNPLISKSIKKANDFGAGGVSVAIGELARGIEVNLNLIPLKYAGLNGTEIAISESQERMAVVISKEKIEEFLNLLSYENIEATEVGRINNSNRLIFTYKGEKIVDLSRDFLNSNGVRCNQDVTVQCSTDSDIFANEFNSIEDVLISPNVSMARGMSELFDSTVGRSTILMPFGGKYQLTEADASVQKIQTSGYTESCSILAYGYNPDIMSKSPYIGAMCSVIESLSRVVAVGGDYSKVRLSFQEYFRKLGKDNKNWGYPFQALLGALEAQLAFETPAIGGKDSMSGTYKDLSVPHTLISFAVVKESTKNIISQEFKNVGNFIYLIDTPILSNNLPNMSKIKDNFDKVMINIKNKKIISASTVKFGGLIETIIKMSIGNKIGVCINTNEDLYRLRPGAIVVESNSELNFGSKIGELIDEPIIRVNQDTISIEEAIGKLTSRYGNVYPNPIASSDIFDKKSICGNVRKSKIRYEEPKVLIAVFPGTNSEYDSVKAFEKAGAKVETFVFRNQSYKEIENSINSLSQKIRESQIFMLPGGFSAADEPDGSGKFIANILQNDVVKGAIEELLSNDGLILGICNGFQGLIKSGLLPLGKLLSSAGKHPTLFRNDINRHISRMVETEIVSTKSPWLQEFSVGQKHILPISHGEGKFIIDQEQFEELYDNGQIATAYCKGSNLNGSHYSIEGITSKCGRIFGKMAHSERFEMGLYKNIVGDKDQDIFTCGVNYFKNREE